MTQSFLAPTGLPWGVPAMFPNFQSLAPLMLHQVVPQQLLNSSAPGSGSEHSNHQGETTDGSASDTSHDHDFHGPKSSKKRSNDKSSDSIPKRSKSTLVMDEHRAKSPTQYFKDIMGDNSSVLRASDFSDVDTLLDNKDILCRSKPFQLRSLCAAKGWSKEDEAHIFQARRRAQNQEAQRRCRESRVSRREVQAQASSMLKRVSALQQQLGDKDEEIRLLKRQVAHLMKHHATCSNLRTSRDSSLMKEPQMFHTHHVRRPTERDAADAILELGTDKPQCA
jgi:hypothetical protein